MKVKPVSSKVLRIIFFLAVSSLAVNLEALMSLTFAQPLELFSYEFVIDEEGFTMVNITYRTDTDSGSSWILVPRFSEWIYEAARGEITEWNLRDTEEVIDEPYYFYEAFCFSFRSDGSEFQMNVQFNLSIAAMIIEPEGIFYSPQIGFEKGRLKAKVVLPEGFSVKQGEALVLGDRGSYRPSSISPSSDSVLFDSVPETENKMRIQVGFKTLNETAEYATLENGVFTFETVLRYEEYARGIMALFNKTYADLVDLFNVTLESAEARFFLADFNSLFEVGGYVPFVAERMGDIHINFVLTRYVEGYIEVVALHELVHHFLWKAGISAQALLWFHEGMAQYVSIEIANKLGYEGSSMMKQELDRSVDALGLKSMVGKDLGFLTGWSPSRQPANMGTYYVAAYYVVSEIAEPRGGLDYYSRFFRTINGETVDSNAAIGYYMSLAAEESVVTTLNSWGFGIPDLYIFSPSLRSVEEVLDEVDPVFQPYKFLAELLYRQALLNAQEENTVKMQIYLAAAVLVSRLAPLLTLVTISAVLFGAILLALREKGVFSSY